MVVNRKIMLCKERYLYRKEHMKEQIQALLTKVELLQRDLQDVHDILYEMKDEFSNKDRMEQSKLGYDNEEIVQDKIVEFTQDNGVRCEEEPVIRPQVLQFFELRTMKERADYLRYTINWKEITENELSLISSSMEIVLQEGNMECKVRDLISYVEKLAQWEVKGTRG